MGIGAQIKNYAKQKNTKANAAYYDGGICESYGFRCGF